MKKRVEMKSENVNEEGKGGGRGILGK